MLAKASGFSCSTLKREVSGVRPQGFVRGRKVASKGEQLGLHVRGNDVDLATGVGNGNLKGRSRELRHDGDVPLVVKVADADTLREAPLGLLKLQPRILRMCGDLSPSPIKPLA